jgi:plasmid stabilization system protein ParE
MKPVRILREAEAEADKAFDWYEEQSDSAAVGFSEELQEAFFAIRKSPQLYPI